MNLLIVDDEIFAIQGLLKDLERLPLSFEHCFTANSYAQAVNVMLENPVDILLCDIEMPYGTGLDLVEWVNGKFPDTACIFLTCHDEFSFAQQAVSLHCLDYVLKPVSAETLCRVLEKAENVIQSKQKEKVYQEYGKRYIDMVSGEDREKQIDSRSAVEQVEAYITAHIDENLNVEELAQMVYLSAAHLSRLFKKKHGFTVVDYITNERMKLARELLENTDMTVSMISAKTGYNNYSYFTKQFRRMYGMTPRELRQKKRPDT